MGKYDFDVLLDRTNTYTAKWDILPQDVEPAAIPLWIADMDFPCAEPIIKALHERTDRLAFGYTRYDNAEIKSAVTGWFKKRYGWEVDGKDLFFCPGVIPAVALFANILCNEGDGVVLQHPVYHPFANTLRANKREIVSNPLIYKDGYYTMDFDDLDKKLAVPSTKGMILCNPHNPVGRVWTEEELKKVVEIAKRHGKWIVSDEIHADLIRKGHKFTPAAKVAGDYVDEVITLTAPSKTFNLAGLKFSNIVITKEEYKNAYNEIGNARFHILGIDPLSMAATVAAYNEGEEWLGEVNEYIDANVEFAVEYFKKEMPKSVPIHIEGTYLFWVDLNGYEQDPDKLDAILKEKARVYLNNGAMFGPGGEGFARINVACPRYILEECLKRMKAVFEG